MAVILPAVVKPVVKKAALLSLRAASRLEELLWRPSEPIPPLHLRLEYYRTVSADGFRQAVNSATNELLSRGLQPQHRVLDIGCGIGNLAVGLSRFLTGQYVGFDIRREAIDWCRANISRTHGNFDFCCADLASNAYNVSGLADARDYMFPLPPSSFDYIFLGSVFTHLLPDTVTHYISEISRLLAPDGICVASAFLLNDSTRPSVRSGQSFITFNVPHSSGVCSLHDSERPEAAVALEEAFLVGCFHHYGLGVSDVRKGHWWSGISHDQDVLTIRRPHKTRA